MKPGRPVAEAQQTSVAFGWHQQRSTVQQSISVVSIFPHPQAFTRDNYMPKPWLLRTWCHTSQEHWGSRQITWTNLLNKTTILDELFLPFLCTSRNLEHRHLFSVSFSKHFFNVKKLRSCLLMSNRNFCMLDIEYKGNCLRNYKQCELFWVTRLKMHQTKLAQCQRLSRFLQVY